MPAWLPPCVVICVLALASIMDIRTRRVPRWLTLGAILVGLLVAGVTGFAALQQSLLGLLLGGLLLLPLVLLRGFGVADALLLAAIGTWLGWEFVLHAAFWAALAGGILALVAWRRGHRTFPYVPALLMGVAVGIAFR
ncbi:MAG: A24 family peptidase [Anaerolineae bacterium]